MWNIEEGINLVRALQPISRKYGYHVAIGGGVVNKGYSDKDLDLYFLPMGGFEGVQDKTNPNGMLEYLEGVWGKSESLIKDYSGIPDRGLNLVLNAIIPKPNPIYKHAVKFIRDERIDCFIF